LTGTRPGSRTLGYQPALDGIRAVAVLGVLVFHAGIERVVGGFLGVDLFFVLSGFLITTLLLREWHRTGGIALGGFYARRVRRLFPALLLVLLAVSVYMRVVAPAATRSAVRLDAVSSLFYVANWRFVFSHQSYFAGSLEPSPLRHLWSLAVEEQWYLVWPLVLTVVLRRLSQRLDVLLAFVLALAVASLGWMAHLVPAHADSSRAYYGTDSHAYVLLLGAALAIWRHQRPARPAWAARPGQVLGIVGLAVIGWYFVAVAGTAHWLYLGGYVPFVVAGLLVVDAAMAPVPTLFKRLLGLAPLAWIGRISYGLYLWHWPIDVWLNPARVHLSPHALTALRLAVTFAVSTVSYYAVERPIRTANWGAMRSPGRATAGFAGVASAAVLVASVLLIGHGTASVPLFGTGGTAAAAKLPGPVPFEPGKLRVMVVGDSVAFKLAYGATGPVTPKVTVIGTGQLGCGLVPYSGNIITADLVWDGSAGSCSAMRQAWDYGLAQKPDLVLLEVGAWEVYNRVIQGTDHKVFTADYERVIDQRLQLYLDYFTSRTRVPVAMLDVPCMRPTEFDLGGGPNVRGDDRRVAWLNGVFRRFAAKHPSQLRIVPISPLLCPNGTYRKAIDGVTLRYDGVHFNTPALKFVWAYLTPKLLELASPGDGRGS
jgi:peptidoglycan/LPS O-acetylase OafA/YrhL